MAGSAGEQQTLRQRGAKVVREGSGIEAVGRGIETMRGRVKQGFRFGSAQAGLTHLSCCQGVV